MCEEKMDKATLLMIYKYSRIYLSQTQSRKEKKGKRITHSEVKEEEKKEKRGNKKKRKVCPWMK